MEYHSTWYVSEWKPPPSVPGLGWSHRCHERRYVKPHRGFWRLSARSCLRANQLVALQFTILLLARCDSSGCLSEPVFFSLWISIVASALIFCLFPGANDYCVLIVAIITPVARRATSLMPSSVLSWSCMRSLS